MCWLVVAFFSWVSLGLWYREGGSKVPPPALNWRCIYAIHCSRSGCSQRSHRQSSPSPDIGSTNRPNNATRETTHNFYAKRTLALSGFVVFLQLPAVCLFVYKWQILCLPRKLLLWWMKRHRVSIVLIVRVQGTRSCDGTRREKKRPATATINVSQSSPVKNKLPDCGRRDFRGIPWTLSSVSRIIAWTTIDINHNKPPWSLH